MDEGRRGRHPRALENCEHAIVDERKLTDYALNPTSELGRHKAKVFKSALGFDKSNWRLLREAILRELPYYEATPGEIDEHGSRFTVVIEILGPNGLTAPVQTCWIIDRGGDLPRLTTAWVRRRAAGE